MRFSLNFARNFLLSLSVATLAIMAAEVRAVACGFTIDPVAGIVCKADPCGFLNLKNCQRIMMFDPITGVLLSDTCICP